MEPDFIQCLHLRIRITIQHRPSRLNHGPETMCQQVDRSTADTAETTLEDIEGLQIILSLASRGRNWNEGSNSPRLLASCKRPPHSDLSTHSCASTHSLANLLPSFFYSRRHFRACPFVASHRQLCRRCLPIWQNEATSWISIILGDVSGQYPQDKDTMEKLAHHCMVTFPTRASP